MPMHLSHALPPTDLPQHGWANTTITGRARLGGIPVGVIAVETRTVEMLQPADPANQDTEARVIQQAGQVCAGVYDLLDIFLFACSVRR